MSLSITNASFSYRCGGNMVLKDFSFTFKPGCFYGIFGANGSGKSTLLKILAGDLTADNPVLLDNRVLSSLKCNEAAEQIAYASQEDELILPFTVKECIALGRYVWKDRNENLITELLREWNIEHLKDKQFAELSGGERQKVKLLRILAQDTRYVLLDEPASSLDLPKQLELYEKLQGVAHREDKCIIMICHDLYIAPDFIDVMLFMKQGRLLYAGKSNTPEAEKAFTEAFERNFNIKRQDKRIEISW